MATGGSDESRETDRPPVDMRMDRPTPARIYDYLLGGKDNFQVDRDAAAQIEAVMGKGVPSAAAWENRRFLQRAVAYLAEAGVDQFIDVGAGLPTQGNVHEIAHRTNPDARVVYVDDDPIVLAYGRALLADNKTTRVITADMRDPEAILSHPDLRVLIDLDRPVAVLFIAALHFLAEDEAAYGVTHAFRDAMAPGSYMAISHSTTDGPPPDQISGSTHVYERSSSPGRARSEAEIRRFFDGFDLVEPGLVRPWQWHPEQPHGSQTYWLYCGVGKKTG